MKRLHLFEVMDQSWFPEVFRNLMTELLVAAGDRAGFDELMMPLLKRLLERTHASQIVDLCSGSGGVPGWGWNSGSGGRTCRCPSS